MMNIENAADVEIDVEDLLTNPFNTQPPSLAQLTNITGFDRRWLMFLYRNFKQRCCNGRMCETDWRAVFRMLFPQASDYEFADRLFHAIAAHRNHKEITFEDLVLCLFDLTSASAAACSDVAEQTGIAPFAFQLMRPDPNGRVSLQSFTLYTQSIFDLCATRGCEVDNAITLGLPGSARSPVPNPVQKRISPHVRKIARERFMALDADQDGWITVKDLERELAGCQAGLLLRSTHEIHYQTASSAREWDRKGESRQSRYTDNDTESHDLQFV